jgi:hypothetical protein
MKKLSSSLIYLLNRPSFPPIRAIVAVLAVLTLGLLSSAKGQTPSATATLTETATSASFNTFALTLQNTSVSAFVETFWFGWVSDEDLLATEPLSIETPAGWTDTITGGGLNDGYAIQFTLSTGLALAPGESLSGFGFTSIDSLAEMKGDSVFYSGTQTATSEVSTGPDNSGNFSVPFVAAVIPEPASVMLVAGGLCMCLWKARRRL